LQANQPRFWRQGGSEQLALLAVLSCCNHLCSNMGGSWHGSKGLALRPPCHGRQYHLQAVPPFAPLTDEQRTWGSAVEPMRALFTPTVAGAESRGQRPAEPNQLCPQGYPPTARDMPATHFNGGPLAACLLEGHAGAVSACWLHSRAPSRPAASTPSCFLAMGGAVGNAAWRDCPAAPRCL